MIHTQWYANELTALLQIFKILFIPKFKHQ